MFKKIKVSIKQSRRVLHSAGLTFGPISSIIACAMKQLFDHIAGVFVNQ